MDLRRAGDERNLASRKVTSPDAAAGFAEAFPDLQVRSLEPGNYAIYCELLPAGGQTVGRFTQPFTKPPAKKGREFGCGEVQYPFAGEAAAP